MIAIRARRNLGYQLVVNFQPDVLLVTQHQDLLIDLDKVMSETRTKAQRAKHSFISTASGTRAPRAALSLNASEASVTFRGRTQTVCRQGSHASRKSQVGIPLPIHLPKSHTERFSRISVGQDLGSISGTCKPHSFPVQPVWGAPDPFVTPTADARDGG